ncbi:serine hydrolase domain-containing protein [Aeoliella sp.]|uniref:serine hydrolase domain-containing protein n=1 Tax=Aeoliella sp. TaxID=2795800 RepID=UPI003CCB90AE
MHRRSLLALFCAALVSAAACQGDDLRSPVRTYGMKSLSPEFAEKIETLDERIPQWMEQHQVLGVSVSMIDDGQLVWSRGYGVRCAGTSHPVDPDTVMEACSMSKPFFAYMLLKLVEQGEFDLSQPLIDYLGEDYLDKEPRQHAITGQMALSHTTGLPNWREGGWQSGGPMTLQFDPGTQFCYSGEGFLMLQRAVEKVTGKGLDEFSRERLIKPLELHHTRFVWDDRFLVNASCGHDGEGRVKSIRKYYHKANAAYSLYTTTEDYARFLVEILKEDRTAPHSISAEMRSRMLTPISEREDQQAEWGLGWGLRKLDPHRQVYHSGSNGTGFRCYSEFFPETGDGLVIMTNSATGRQLWEAAVDQWHSSGT